jgi:hypothetical protein
MSLPSSLFKCNKCSNYNELEHFWVQRPPLWEPQILHLLTVHWDLVKCLDKHWCYSKDLFLVHLSVWFCKHKSSNLILNQPTQYPGTMRNF